MKKKVMSIREKRTM